MTHKSFILLVIAELLNMFLGAASRDSVDFPVFWLPEKLVKKKEIKERT